ncbi:DOPA-like domain-containing protein [Rhodotorula diobovata]|uniref:DOPA-like domain-containing protein n=1 Tax=Rhodotorula diobovata TaxID=5288 RepID=A0A5C5FSP9_9BASI|nr:DOPA-like domain-containing protein [Rhodotorula diobovata]
MSAPHPTAYRDPLASLPASLPPLSDERQPDGKSLVNPPRPDAALSPWYASYPEELDESNNAFDVHVYYNEGAQTDHARRLHERIRREFPELRVYRFWDKPVGPHPLPMFEVNTFTPAQFGALFGFLVAYRGDLSVLIHPNTHESELLDHTVKATWMGERLELNLDPLRKDEGRFSGAKAPAGPARAEA